MNEKNTFYTPPVYRKIYEIEIRTGTFDELDELEAIPELNKVKNNVPGVEIYVNFIILQNGIDFQ